VSLLLGYGALQCLFTLSYNAIPFFGQVLTGTAAAVVTLITAAILGLLAREVCRLRMSAWWAVVAVCILGALSNILTFLQVSLPDFVGTMGFAGSQLDLMKSMPGLESFNIPLWTTIGTGAGLAYLLYARKYFAAGQDAGRGPLEKEGFASDPG